MQNYSTTPLRKGDLFVTGSAELNNLLQIYWQQLNAMAEAELAGLPEPELKTPPLPNYLIYRI